MGTEVGDLGREAKALVEIESQPELKLSFKRWEESFKVLLTSIESKRGRVLAAKNEMYLLSSLYFVFQGGLLNIVISKADTIECYQTSFTFLLSFLASIAILCSVHDKFHDYHKMKLRLKKAESEARELEANMSLMLRLGARFAFAKDDYRQQISQATTSSLAVNNLKWHNEEPHYHDVMVFLCVFSLTVLGLHMSTLIKRY